MYCNAMDTHACFSNNLRGTFKTRLNYFIQELSCMTYAPRVVNYELRDLVADSPLDGG